MMDIECTLRKRVIATDEIGVEKETMQETTIPIIRNEKIYAREFYEASQLGFRPSLRIRISALNYSNEEELEYNNEIYTIIRIDNEIDELVLICERKIGNG